MGTAGYMSPEQARAKSIDYRSDQFSLGLMMYEMLAGKQAFERPSAVQTMSAIVEEDPPPIDRALPPQLRWILQRCLAKEPEERYESTRDLARELSHAARSFQRIDFGTTGNCNWRPRARARAIHKAGFWPILRQLARWRPWLAWSGAQLLRDPTVSIYRDYRVDAFCDGIRGTGLAGLVSRRQSIAFFGLNERAHNRSMCRAVDSPTAVAITGAGPTVHYVVPALLVAGLAHCLFPLRHWRTGGFLPHPSGGWGNVVVQRGVLYATHFSGWQDARHARTRREL